MTNSVQQKQKTPQLRFPEFSGEWQSQKLDSITSVYDGTHQTPDYVDEGVPFYSVEQVTADDFSDTRFIKEEVFKEESKKVKLEKFDILMTRIGDIGTAKLIDWDVQASFYVSLALIKSPDDISSKYLLHYIKSEQFQKELWKRTIHVAYPKKINLGEIRECYVMIAPRKEQKKIADFFSSVDVWVENLKSQKEKLEEYKCGLMQKLFPAKGQATPQLRFPEFSGEWEEVKLGDFSEITTGSSNKKDASNNGEYAFFDRSVDALRSSKFLFDDSAIIVPGEGTSFEPRYHKGKFDLHQRAYAILKSGSDTNWQFLFYLICTSQKHFKRMAVGSTMPSLRMPVFEKMQIRIPSPEEQNKIASFLSSVDGMMDKKQEEIAAAKKWKRGLMQKMFV